MTEQRAKQALKESEERYRAVMEQSVEAIYLYDAEPSVYWSQMKSFGG